MSFRLNILPRAEADVDAMFDWLEERSPSGASSWLSAFQCACERVTVNPYGYGLARENDLVEFEIRAFPFKTRRGRIYRGVYTIVEDEVRIVRVRGPGQADLSSDEIGAEDD